MLSWTISLILSLLWLSLHFLYHFVTHVVDEVGWHCKYIFNRLLSCTPSYSEHGQLINIFYTAKLLKTQNKKTPKHLGLVVFEKESPPPFQSLWTNFKGVLFFKKNGNLEKNSQNMLKKEDGDGDRVDFQALAKVVCYAWIADIGVVSLYDYNGHVKSNYNKLLHQVQIEISQHRWIVGDRTRVPPTVKLHNVPRLQNSKNGYTNGHANGTNGMHITKDQPETLNICLFSYDDGKEVIIQTCKELCQEILHSKEGEDVLCQSISEINEKIVDEKLNAAVGLQFTSDKEKIDFKTEPDLMMVFGKFASTTGFLPWHIRLTEIHWVPSLKRFNENDFLRSMLKYANCNQRFGT